MNDLNNNQQPQYGGQPVQAPQQPYAQAPQQPMQPQQPYAQAPQQPQYAQQPMQQPYAQAPQQPMQQPYGQAPQYGQQPMMQPQYGMQGGYTATKSKTPLIIVLIIVAVVAIAAAIIIPIVLSNNGGGGNGGTSGVPVDPLVGSWRLDADATAAANGMEGMGSAFAGFTFNLTLNADGSYSGYVNLDGESQSVNGTWTKSSSSLTLNQSDGIVENVPYSMEGGKLKISTEGVYMVLVK